MQSSTCDVLAGPPEGLLGPGSGPGAAGGPLTCEPAQKHLSPTHILAGTSNWSENYFSSTSGVGLVLSQRAPNTQPGPPTAQEQLRQLFERDWSSRYAVRLDGQAQGQDCVWQD